MFPTPQPRQRPTPPQGHRGVAPPGWPRQVRPPDAPDWEVTAASWLLDLCPPDYRRFSGLRRHVVVLARFAVLHVEAQQAARRGLSQIRGDLKDVATRRWRPPCRPSSSTRPGCSAYAARSGWSRTRCAGGATASGCEAG